MKHFYFNVDKSIKEVENIEKTTKFLEVTTSEGSVLKININHFEKYKTQYGIKGNFMIKVNVNNKMISLAKI